MAGLYDVDKKGGQLSFYRGEEMKLDKIKDDFYRLGYDNPKGIGDFEPIAEAVAAATREAVKGIKAKLPTLPDRDVLESLPYGGSLERDRLRRRIKGAIIRVLEGGIDEVADSAVRVAVEKAGELGVEDEARLELVREFARSGCRLMLVKERDMHDPDLGEDVWF